MTMVKLMYYFCFGLLWRFRGIDHLKWLISLQQKQTQSRKKSLLLFIVVKYMYNNNQEFSFVAQCGHLRCISWRFDCILLVFISRWRRLLTHRPFEQDASLWFVGFQQLWLVFAVSVSCSLGGRCRTVLLLLCYLIVGIHDSGISIPLSLLMLLGWNLIWIGYLTLRVHRLLKHLGLYQLLNKDLTDRPTRKLSE